MAAWGRTVRRRVGSPLALLLRELKSSATPVRNHGLNRATPPQTSRMPPHENWALPQPLVTLQQSPGSKSQWPGTRQQTPGTQTWWPGSHSKAPGRRKLSPGTQAEPPGKLRPSPGKRQQSPGGPDNSPGSLAGGFFAAWACHSMAALGQTVRRRVGSPPALLLRGLRSSVTPVRTHELSLELTHIFGSLRRIL